MAHRANHLKKNLRHKLLLAKQLVSFLEKTLAEYDDETEELAYDEILSSDTDSELLQPIESSPARLSINNIPHDQPLLLDILGIGTMEWSATTNTAKTSVTWDTFFGCLDYDCPSPLSALYACLEPSDLPFVKAHVKKFLTSTLPVSRITLRIIKKGKIHWIETVLIAQRSTENIIEKLNCFAMDITFTKEREIFFKKELDILNDCKVGFPSVSLDVNKDYFITNISPSAFHYTDINPENLLHIPLSAFFQTQGTSSINEKINRVFESNDPIKFTTKLTFYNQKTITAVIQLWPVMLPDSSMVDRVNLRIWDTGSTHIENFYSLFSNLADGFILVRSLPSQHDSLAVGEEPFTIIVMNQALASVYNTNFRTHVGQSLKSLVGQDFEQWSICLQQVAMRQKPVIYCMKNKEKGTLLELSAFPSGLDSIACIVKDATSLHAAEQAIIINEARASALYRLSFMYESPMTAVLEYALSQIIQLTGSETGMIAFYDIDTEKYELWLQGAHEVEVLDNLSLEDLEQREGFPSLSSAVKPYVVNTIDEPFYCSNGKLARRYMIAPIFDEGKMVCIARVSNKGGHYEPGDLRQLELFLNGIWFHLRRRWANEHLERAKEIAETANQAKDMFLANVSHELRTPLNGILGMLQLLRQSSLTPEQYEWIHVAIDSGRGLMRIISDILNIARVDANQYEVVTTTFNFASSIQSTLSMFCHKAAQKNIDFSISIDEKIPHALIGDEALLRQIILNIVGNAFKFTNTGKIAFECSMLPIATKNAACLYIGVHDTGIGIDQDQLNQIFKPFTQLDGSLTRKYSGAGLGLSIVHRLVTVMRGTLCIDSALGKGTSFHLSLPFKEGKQSDIICENPSAIIIAKDKLAVLVAEDDPVNQFTIKTMLQKMGHEVFCVENGSEALEALQVNNFDCIITDIQMPGMDGEELIERIRKGDFSNIRPTNKVQHDMRTPFDAVPLLNRNIPIIALSAHAMNDMEGHFVDKLGADFYMEKPLSLLALSNVLKEISQSQNEKNS